MDVISWKKIETQEEINNGREEGNVAPDGPHHVNAMANSAAVQESDVDDYYAASADAYDEMR